MYATDKVMTKIRQRAGHWYLLLLFGIPHHLFAAPSDSLAGASSVAKEPGYRIEQPGTITFTVGAKISGKVEKPQVMIFLPKEKTVYRSEVLHHSFDHDLMEPLPLKPVLE